MSASYRGRHLWYELLTHDLEAAEAFYRGLIGWGIQLWEGLGTPYRMWTRGEVPLGGIMQMPAEAKAQGAPPHWLGYVGTPDVDATATRAVALGSKAHVPPTDIPTVGRFAVLADPQGALFAVYRPENEPAEPEGPPQPGQFSWHELATDDPARAFGFYSDLFGWEKFEAMDMGPAGVYQIWGRNGVQLGGMFRRPAEMPVCAWLYYTMVDDVDVAAGTVKELGGQVVNGPMEVPGGDRILQGMDPQGGMFALHSRAKGA